MYGWTEISYPYFQFSLSTKSALFCFQGSAQNQIVINIKAKLVPVEWSHALLIVWPCPGVILFIMSNVLRMPLRSLPDVQNNFVIITATDMITAAVLRMLVFNLKGSCQEFL